MGRSHRLLAAALAALALAAAVLATACSADPPAPRWEEVTSGHFTGAKTERLDLGTFYLVKGARLAWDLTGPGDARSEFRLLVQRAPDARSLEGYGTSLRSWKENFATRSGEALSVAVPEPGEYHVTLTQRLPRDGSVGYAGSFTLYTRDLD
jgi:hypothetical protein